MLQKKLILLALLLIQLGLTGIIAQEAMPISGVQQPVEITNITEMDELKGIALFCSARPDASTDFLLLKIMGLRKKQYTASLYDLNGTCLESRRITGAETSLEIRNLFPSIYFLKVSFNNKDVKIFKIIKKLPLN